ncbi:MAG TPA: NAD(P)-dependent oxidoreductase [Sphingomonas sp.]|jgi:UDP-glucose 4-epimerase|nr:NAD(P)-dependent oxidoreductase [Sphingomonas sp.]
MRILLTGANGFVGIEATRQLREHHEVLALDVLRYCPWRIEGGGSVELLKVDLRDREATHAAIARFKPEAIIHLAAIHFIPECEQKPDEAVSINVEATVNLLSACPPGCRFVFASTAAVYAPSEVPHHETRSTIGPMDVYGYTKLWGEDMVRYYAAKGGFEAVVVRLFNVVGPGETNPHLVPDILKQLKRGTRTLQLGNTTPKRDYIHVADAAAGFIAAGTRPVPHGGGVTTANLGTGREYSVDEVVATISEVIGDTVTIEVDPARVRKSDRPHLCADNGQMSTLFGWSAQHDLASSMRATWDDPRMLEQLL